MASLDVRRRHGDIYPLAPRDLRRCAEVANVYEPQRAYWIGTSLNKLALQADSNSHSKEVLCSSLAPTAAQQSVIDRVVSSSELHGSCPDHLTCEAALSGMRRDKPTYDGVPSNLATFDHEKLKILKKVTQPKRIVDFLPPTAAAMVKNYQSSILRECVEQKPSVTPYWDPILKRSPEVRIDFITRLFRAGLMDLRSKPKSFVGVFFVKKKTNDQIRMVIDSRTTNELCCDPPVTRLGSARCYSDLRFDRIRPSHNQPYAWGQEADVDDCFYRFAIPEMTQFFALNCPLTRSAWESLGIECSKVFDPDCGENFRPSADQPLYPCFRVVPMGWNWALFLCHEAVLRIAQTCSPWNDGVLREKRVVPQLDEFRTVLGVYVDNITILGVSKNDVVLRSEALQQAFDNAGIPISWTQSEPCVELDSVGCRLDLFRGIIQNKPQRVWSFVRATSALLKRKKLHGKILQVWAGHFTSLCSITPWGLSILQSTYKFIQKSLDKRIVVWPSVRRELKIAASLSWMTWRPLGCPLMRVVEIGDSATSGYALMAGEPPEDIVRRAMSVHEKWRFIPLPEELKSKVHDNDVDGFVQTLHELLQPPKPSEYDLKPHFAGIRVHRKGPLLSPRFFGKNGDSTNHLLHKSTVNLLGSALPMLRWFLIAFMMIAPSRLVPSDLKSVPGQGLVQTSMFLPWSSHLTDTLKIRGTLDCCGLGDGEIHPSTFH